jgi:ABC-type dipeptide/oligopeptide/nickel transport system permease subunit
MDIVGHNTATQSGAMGPASGRSWWRAAVTGAWLWGGEHGAAVFRSKKVLFGGVLLLVMVGITLLAPVLSPFDPNAQTLDARLLPPAWSGGDWAHPLGTDHLGRDILSRIMYGGRISLLIGAAAVLVSGTVGITVGLVCGFYGGRIDSLVMRAADVQLAFPQILLVILVLVLLGRSLPAIIVVLALADWVIYARLVRGRLLVERQREYVEAARALGAGGMRIMFKHLLPNLASLIIVIATLQLALMILLESSLSYLGIGVQPPTSSWGRMLNDGQPYMAVAWWVSTLPGLAIVFTVLGVNFLGDGLREALGID